MAGRPAVMNRQNEYFVPRDGIDREVITADICRYLGNDALVRPGTYENKETGQLIQGYYINAYRNLTTAMIEDLKEASRQWALERTRVANGAYRHSETHQRQQGGVGVGVAAVPEPPYGNPAQTPYDPRYQQPTQPYQTAPVQQYGGQPQYPRGQGNYPFQTQPPVTRSPPPPMDPYTAPAPQPGYPDPPYHTGGNLRNVYNEPQQERYSGQNRYPQASVPAQQPGYVAVAPNQQQYYAQAQPAHGSYVPQANVQPQDPFLGRSGKGQTYGSPDPSYEDQAGRTVTPTGNVAAQPPPAGQRRDRDSRTHQHRSHKY